MTTAGTRRMPSGHEPDRRRRDEERPFRSKQGTGNKPKNHLTEKPPYKSANHHHDRLMAEVAARISDRRVLGQIRDGGQHREKLSVQIAEECPNVGIACGTARTAQRRGRSSPAVSLIRTSITWPSATTPPRTNPGGAGATLGPMRQVR